MGPRFKIIIILLATGFVFGCTKKSKIDYNLELKDTIRWQVLAEPPSLDYILATDTTSAWITDNLMDGLVRYSFTANETITEPSLSTTWESSKDFKTWTFTLRQDVKWTDGVPFTAQQVVDGWERLLNPKTGAEYANFLFNVKNGQKYFEGKIKDFKDVGIKINEKGQLVVTLETAQSFFPAILGHHSTFPIRKDVIEKFGDKWTEPANYVGLGAFKLKIWDHDKAIVLERNDDYFGKKAKIKNILGRIIPETSTALNMFKKGEIDAMDEIPSIEIQTVKTMKEYKRMPLLAVYYYGFNVKMAPFDNVKVRRAISMAIDREEINKILGGEKLPAYNIVPPGLVGHDATIGLKFNLAAAQQLMDEAGYKDRSKFPRIHFSFNTNENHQRIAENVQAQLKKNLGIELEITNEEWKTYLKSLEAKKLQMFRFAWSGDYPDADTFMNLFITTGGNNKTNWGNARYDELIKQGVSEADKEKRVVIYAEAQRLIDETEVPIVPLYYYRDQYLVNTRIKNYPMNVLHRFYANEIEILN